MIIECTSMFCKIIFQSKTFSPLHIYFRLGRLQNSKAVSTWAVMFPDKTSNVYYYLLWAVVFRVQYLSEYLYCSADVWWNTTRIAL
jgi:hypothetical protein